MKITADEATLTDEERLGLAYCRLLDHQWDSYIGKKPEGYDELPEFSNGGEPSKHWFAVPRIVGIVRLLGEAKVSWYYWKFVLGRTYDEWVRWWLEQEMGGWPDGYFPEETSAERRRRSQAKRAEPKRAEPGLLVWLVVLGFNAMTLLFQILSRLR